MPILTLTDSGKKTTSDTGVEGNSLYLNGAWNSVTAEVGGTTFLYVISFIDSAVQIFEVGSDGGLTAKGNVVNGDNDGIDGATLALFRPRGGSVASVGENTFLFVAASKSNSVLVFQIGNDGLLTAVSEQIDGGAIELVAPWSTATAEIDGTTFLFVASATSDSLQVFEVGSDGSLTDRGQQTHSAGTQELNGANSVAVSVVGGITFIVVASHFSDAVQVFQVADDGGLTPTDNKTLADSISAGDDPLLALDSAKGISTATVGGNELVFVAGETSDGVQVFQLGSDGKLTAKDQKTDAGLLELDGAHHTTTAEIGGATYLFVAGYSDDGLQVFEVASDGSLTDRGQQIDGGNSGALALDAARGVHSAVIGGKTFIFVTAYADKAVQVFEASTPNAAPVITLPAAPSVVKDATNVAISDAIDIADVDADSQTVTLTITGGTASIDTANVSLTVGDGTNDATITFGGSVTQVNAALDSLTFTPTAGLSGTNAGAIRIQSDDGDGGTDDKTVTFDITAAPSATGVPGDVSVTEDTASNFDLTAVTFSDDDSDSLTVTLAASAGTFTAINSGDVTIGGSGTNSLTLAGTVGNINTFLGTVSNIQYTGALNVSGTDAATYTLNANDTTVNPQVGNGTIDITAVDDEPTLTATGSNPTFTEGSAAASLFTGTSISTIDSGQTITGLTITVSNVNDGASELLNADGTAITLTNGASGTTATNSLTYSVSVSGTDATVTFSAGTVSTGNMQTFVDGLSYQNDSDTPNTNNRAVTLTSLTDSGSNSGTNDNITTLSVASTVTVAAVNDKPTIAGTTTLAQTEDAAATAMDLSGISVTDVDTTGDITLTITSADAGSRLNAVGEGTTVNNVDVAEVNSHSISLTGTVAELNAYLAAEGASNITYQTSDNGDGNDTLSLVANDGNSNSDTADHTITVTAQDDAPTVASVPDQSVFQQVAKDLSLGATTVADVDTANLTVIVSVNTGGLVSDAAGGNHPGGAAVEANSATTITLTGTAAQINAYFDDTDELAFSSAASLNNVTLTVSVNDGVNPVVTDTATISVVDGDTPTATTANYNGTEDTAVTLDTVGMAVTQELAAVDTLNYITITGITGGTLALGAGAASKAGDGTTDTAAVGAITNGALINPADIGKLTFTPTANSTTAATVTYTVTDTGQGLIPRQPRH